MHRTHIRLLKNTALSVLVLLSQLSAADDAFVPSVPETEHSISTSGTAVDGSGNAWTNLVLPEQVTGTAEEFSRVIKVADDNGDKRLTGPELIKAYYNPDTEPDLYPLIAMMRINLSVLQDQGSDSITLDSYRDGFSRYFGHFDLSNIYSEDALWAYAYEEDAVKRKTMRRLFLDGLKGIRPENIFQRRVGDCQLISSIASLAKKTYGKRVILNYFESLGDSLVKVTFPGGKQPVVIALDEVDYMYAKSLNGDWLAVLENAVAKYTIDYNDIPRVSEYYRVDDTNKRRLEAAYGDYKVLEAISTQYVTPLLTGKTVGSVDTTGTVGYWLASMVMSRVLSLFSVTTVGIDDSNPGLYPELYRGHTYSLLAYDQAAHRLTLRDPGGTSEIINPDTGEAADGLSDGIFTISLEDLAQLNATVYY